jgi:hypothetical protein
MSNSAQLPAPKHDAVGPCGSPREAAGFDIITTDEALTTGLLKPTPHVFSREHALTEGKPVKQSAYHRHAPCEGD